MFIRIYLTMQDHVAMNKVKMIEKGDPVHFSHLIKVQQIKMEIMK